MAQAFLVQKSGGGINQTLPSQITAFTATADTTPSITLSWTNPTEYFGGVLIVKKIGSAPTSPTDGEKIYSGTAETFTDADVQFDTEYFYRAFAYNSKKQYQTLYAVASAEPRSGLLVSTLPVGSFIKVPVLSAYQSRFGENIMWKVADKNHSGYPSNSVTLITEKIIQLMAFDAKEPNNSNSHRKQYGNNRYLYSNLLQWLNSNAAAGAWYSAQHSADQAPTTKTTHVTYNPYTSWAGFFAMLEPKFIAELLDTTQTVVKNTVTDGGSYETVTSKMFLASTSEVGLANENSIAEGTLLALFSDKASRVAYPTAECVSNADGYTDSGFATSKGWHWWLRTPNSSNAHYVRLVSSDGSLNHGYAYYGYYGVRPLCNISGNALVDPTPNADGSYNLLEVA